LFLQTFGAIWCNCYVWIGLVIIQIENWTFIFKQNRLVKYKIIRASEFYDRDIFQGSHSSARNFLSNQQKIEENEPPNQLNRLTVFGAALVSVQRWCNQRGKDGFYGLNGHS